MKYMQNRVLVDEGGLYQPKYLLVWCFVYVAGENELCQEKYLSVFCVCRSVPKKVLLGGLCMRQVKVDCTKRSTCWCFVCVAGGKWLYQEKYLLVFCVCSRWKWTVPRNLPVGVLCMWQVEMDCTKRSTCWCFVCVAGESGLCQETYLLAFCVCGRWKRTVPREAPVGVLCVCSRSKWIVPRNLLVGVLCVAGESRLYQETYLLVFCVCGRRKWIVPKDLPVGVFSV